MAPRKSSPAPPTPEACEHVLTKVRAAAVPTDARGLVKQLEPPFQLAARELTLVLNEFVTNGLLIRYPAMTAKGADRYWDRDLNAIGKAATLEALHQTELPVTAKDLAPQLRGPYKYAEKHLVPILQEAAADGQITRFPPKTAKGKLRYWHLGHEEYGRRMLLQLLQSKGPQTVAKLQASLKDLDQSQFDAVFQSLRAAGTLFVHPPVKSGAELFGLRPPAPEVYLKNVQTELTKAVAKLRNVRVPLDALRRAIVQISEAAGVPFSGTVIAAPPAETCVVNLLDLLRRLDSGTTRGTLVTARDLRQAAGLPKSTFDREVLNLARSGQVSLHKHDFPASLTESERDELIADGHGNFFIGLALRQSGV